MPRIAGGGSAIPPDRISSTNSTESIKETKTEEKTIQAESTSATPSENKQTADTRAVTEHRMIGNLQQMRLNSMLNLQTKRGIDSSSVNTNNGAIIAGDFNYNERAKRVPQETESTSYQTQDGGTQQAWEAYPIKWEGPDFDTTKNEVATESLEIAHVGLKSTTSPFTPGGVEYPNLTIYIPEQNDTLQSIAFKFGISEEALAKANNLNPREPLTPGIQLKIVSDK